MANFSVGTIESKLQTQALGIGKVSSAICHYSIHALKPPHYSSTRVKAEERHHFIPKRVHPVLKP
jgi:hypothetical protein